MKHLRFSIHDREDPLEWGRGRELHRKAAGLIYGQDPMHQAGTEQALGEDLLTG